MMLKVFLDQVIDENTKKYWGIIIIILTHKKKKEKKKISTHSYDPLLYSFGYLVNNSMVQVVRYLATL